MKNRILTKSLYSRWFLFLFFLFQAKKIVSPESISKDFTNFDYVDANVSWQAGTKGDEVKVFKDLVFIKKSFHRRSD